MRQRIYARVDSVTVLKAGTLFVAVLSAAYFPAGSAFAQSAESFPAAAGNYCTPPQVINPVGPSRRGVSGPPPVLSGRLAVFAAWDGVYHYNLGADFIPFTPDDSPAAAIPFNYPSGSLVTRLETDGQIVVALVVNVFIGTVEVQLYDIGSDGHVGPDPITARNDDYGPIILNQTRLPLTITSLELSSGVVTWRVQSGRVVGTTEQRWCRIRNGDCRRGVFHSMLYDQPTDPLHGFFSAAHFAPGFGIIWNSFETSTSGLGIRILGPGQPQSALYEPGAPPVHLLDFDYPAVMYTDRTTLFFGLPSVTPARIPVYQVTNPLERLNPIADFAENPAFNGDLLYAFSRVRSPNPRNPEKQLVDLMIGAVRSNNNLAGPIVITEDFGNVLVDVDRNTVLTTNQWEDEQNNRLIQEIELRVCQFP